MVDTICRCEPNEVPLLSHLDEERMKLTHITPWAGLLLLVSFLGISCIDEASGVGSKWVETSFRNVLIDTCTVHLSTILTDSIATSGDSITQIGRYSDEYRGTIRAGLFTEYNVAKTTFTPENTYQFDSITITFRTTGNYLGDTLTNYQSLSIHRLSENLALNNDSYIYNNSTFRYDPAPLATHSYKPRPKSKSAFEVRLPDAFGEGFFNLIREQSIYLDEQERFRVYFPGFAILPDDTNDCITGFAVNDSSMCITMYYREISTATTERTLTFTPNATYRFNQSSQDFTGSPFEGIVPGTINAVRSDKSGNMSYLQGLSGVYTKLEFPYLNDLRMNGELVTIESAILYLFPVSRTYGGYAPLPESLVLYTADENDVTQDVITDSSGEVVQDGNLVSDDNQGVNPAYYSFDITSFMQANLGTVGMNRQNLMLMLPTNQFLTTVEGLFLGDSNHANNNVKLQILFKAYNP